ncbi:hypothetical protein BDY21DRAFT_370342 [Lineolata rhizophorae]|uniref:Uncharacterized protein n=1 Tax=Lineolata rhizophorae TaxID=578093 RepID=A0A6A6P6N2_9PEZI|nr:hypothetical protein BDY21DRAFT_370342 [Lineolata rhizophorae]
MSNSSIPRHYARILSRWPVDNLRPHLAFQTVLRTRLAASSSTTTTPPTAPPSSGPPARLQPHHQTPAAADLRAINALYTLLEDRYRARYPVSAAFRRPRANPTYYDDLAREIGEAPGRGWWARVALKVKGFVRWK